MELLVDYDEPTAAAILSVGENFSPALWNRIVQACSQADSAASLGSRTIRLSWGAALPVLLQLGALRAEFDFAMRSSPKAQERLLVFRSDRNSVREARVTDYSNDMTERADARNRLQSLGFTRRELRTFQLRDLTHLMKLRNGANYSVPGAGKTSVTLGLHLLTRTPQTYLLVIAPKNAFGAWDEVVDECMDESAPNGLAAPLLRLDGDASTVERLLASGHRRFIISYDKLIRISDIIERFLARRKVHVVLDEAHRIKAGYGSLRGQAVLNLAALAERRDILTGTPAPNSLGDLAPQLDFLWPGVSLGSQIRDTESARDVLQNLYVRTTKAELGLLPPKRKFRHVTMGRAQLMFYGVLRSEVIRQLTNIRNSTEVDFIAARRSVMRLLQASANPVAAAVAMSGTRRSRDDAGSELLAAVINEGDSPKIREAVATARILAAEGKKSVIWTIFRPTIDRLEALAVDLNPVVLHGGVPTGGEEDFETREGRIRRFHDDPTCCVLIANPAACSEGISLHTVCHDAIYVDRSYNAAHYMQSVDRIHRLGLAPGVETQITILQSVAPERVGSIDHSVSRRLMTKMRTMESILDDPDIRQMALDEEESEPPVDPEMTADDFADLLEQLLTGAIPEDEEQA